SSHLIFRRRESGPTVLLHRSAPHASGASAGKTPSAPHPPARSAQASGRSPPAAAALDGKTASRDKNPPHPPRCAFGGPETRSRPRVRRETSPNRPEWRIRDPFRNRLLSGRENRENKGRGTQGRASACLPHATF